MGCYASGFSADRLHMSSLLHCFGALALELGPDQQGACSVLERADAERLAGFMARDLARLQKLALLVSELLDAWTQAAQQIAPRTSARPATAAA